MIVYLCLSILAPITDPHNIFFDSQNADTDDLNPGKFLNLAES